MMKCSAEDNDSTLKIGSDIDSVSDNIWKCDLYVKGFW